MQIVVLAVGKLKENYWRDAQAEYVKRLSRYGQVEVVEVEDDAAPDNPSPSDYARVLAAEAERISRYLKDRDAIITLDIRGKMLTSEAWSEKFYALQGEGYGRFVFVVGGSFGLDQSLLARAAFRWSFGAITLPHQLARIVLLEQVYRGIRIGRGEPYHK